HTDLSTPSLHDALPISLLPGQELGDADLGDDARVEVGRALARFLRDLHEAEVACDLPGDANRRADMSDRVPKTRDQLADLDAERSEEHTSELQSLTNLV